MSDIERSEIDIVAEMRSTANMLKDRYALPRIAADIRDCADLVERLQAENLELRKNNEGETEVNVWVKNATLNQQRTGDSNE